MDSRVTIPIALALAGGLTSVAVPAHARGVEAGTLITNSATATYTSGASSGSVSSNTVQIRVDELLDVAVSGPAGTRATLAAESVALPFTVTNTGNGPEAFNLAVNPAVAGNQFDPELVSLVIDSNGNGLHDPGIDAILPAGAPTPVLVSDETLAVFVLVRLPAGAADGQTGQLRLTAAALTGAGAPGTSFTGQGQGGGDAVVGNSGAESAAQADMVAALASVSLVKSATIADPFGGTRPVPGAIVSYSIVASVSGSGTANALRIADSYPAGTTYQPGTLRLDSAGLTDTADADAGEAGTGGILVLLGDLPGGTVRTISFNVKIN